MSHASPMTQAFGDPGSADCRRDPGLEGSMHVPTARAFCWPCRPAVRVCSRGELRPEDKYERSHSPGRGSQWHPPSHPCPRSTFAPGSRLVRAGSPVDMDKLLFLSSVFHDKGRRCRRHCHQLPHHPHDLHFGHLLIRLHGSLIPQESEKRERPSLETEEVGQRLPLSGLLSGPKHRQPQRKFLILSIMCLNASVSVHRDHWDKWCACCPISSQTQTSCHPISLPVFSS